MADWTDEDEKTLQALEAQVSKLSGASTTSSQQQSGGILSLLRPSVNDTYDAQSTEPDMRTGLKTVWDRSNQKARENMESMRQISDARFNRIAEKNKDIVGTDLTNRAAQVIMNPKNYQVDMSPEEYAQVSQIAGGVTGQGLMNNKFTPISDINRKASGKLMNIATESPELTAEQGAKILDQGVGTSVTRSGLKGKIDKAKDVAGEKLGEVANTLENVSNQHQINRLNEVKQKYINPDTGQYFPEFAEEGKLIDEKINNLHNEVQVGTKPEWTEAKPSSTQNVKVPTGKQVWKQSRDVPIKVQGTMTEMATESKPVRTVNDEGRIIRVKNTESVSPESLNPQPTQPSQEGYFTETPVMSEKQVIKETPVTSQKIPTARMTLREETQNVPIQQYTKESIEKAATPEITPITEKQVGSSSGKAAFKEKKLLGKKANWNDPQASLKNEIMTERNLGIKEGMEEAAKNKFKLQEGEINPVTEAFADYTPLAESSKNLDYNPTNLVDYIKRFARGVRGNITSVIPMKTLPLTATASTLHKVSKLPIDKTAGIATLIHSSTSNQPSPPQSSWTDEDEKTLQALEAQVMKLQGGK